MSNKFRVCRLFTDSYLNPTLYCIEKFCPERYVRVQVNKVVRILEVKSNEVLLYMYVVKKFIDDSLHIVTLQI